MKPYDWSKFTLRIPIKTNIKTIYDLWTTPTGLEKWFLREARFKKPDGTENKANEHVAVGDSYEWRWHGYDDSTLSHGKVLEINGKDLFSFTFDKATVAVTVKQEEGEVILELIQENMGLDEDSKVNYHLGCITGWTFHLADLKCIVEGGPDLRNKNIKLKNVLNA